MATAAVDNDHISCAICWEPFRKPQSLKCGHVFCTPCIDQVRSRNLNGQIQCSTCRTVSEERDIRRDYKLEEIVEHYIQNQDLKDCGENQKDEKEKRKPSRHLLCETCSENSFRFKCSDCNELLCQNCTDMHRKFKISRDHKILTLDEIKAPVTASIQDLIEGYKALQKKLGHHQYTLSTSKSRVIKAATKAKQDIDQFMKTVQLKCEQMAAEVDRIKSTELAKIQERCHRHQEILQAVNGHASLLSEIVSTDDAGTLFSPGLLDEMTGNLDLGRKQCATLDSFSVDDEFEVSVPDGLDAFLSGLKITKSSKQSSNIAGTQTSVLPFSPASQQMQQPEVRQLPNQPFNPFNQNQISKAPSTIKQITAEQSEMLRQRQEGKLEELRIQESQQQQQRNPNQQQGGSWQAPSQPPNKMVQKRVQIESPNQFYVKYCGK